MVRPTYSTTSCNNLLYSILIQYAIFVTYLGVLSGLQRLYCVRISHSLTWHLTKLWPCRSPDICKQEPAHRIWSILLPKLNTSAPELCDQQVYASLLRKNIQYEHL